MAKKGYDAISKLDNFDNIDDFLSTDTDVPSESLVFLIGKTFKNLEQNLNKFIKKRGDDFLRALEGQGWTLTDTITSPYHLTVEGTTDWNGIYASVGKYNEHPRYLNDYFNLYYDDDEWILEYNSQIYIYSKNTNKASPTDVEEWGYYNHNGWNPVEVKVQQTQIQLDDDEVASIVQAYLDKKTKPVVHDRQKKSVIDAIDTIAGEPVLEGGENEKKTLEDRVAVLLRDVMQLVIVSNDGGEGAEKETAALLALYSSGKDAFLAKEQIAGEHTLAQTPAFLTYAGDTYYIRRQPLDELLRVTREQVYEAIRPGLPALYKKDEDEEDEDEEVEKRPLRRRPTTTSSRSCPRASAKRASCRCCTAPQNGSDGGAATT